VSVGMIGNCAEVLPELVRRGVEIDAITDQTSAHDPLSGYIPTGLSIEGAIELRRTDAASYIERSMESMGRHVQAMLDLKRSGAVAFDYGNNIRKMAYEAGVKDAFEIPGFVPEYIRPLFCEGKGPFRWVALSGDANDIRRTDDLALELFPDDQTLNRWLRLSRDRVQFQGLPSRICWLGYGERAEMGEAINELVRRGDLKAPIAIGRDHLDTDRRNERRIGRGGRLADSQRSPEHGQRRQLGFISSRRRCGHGLFAARGPGFGRRWN
jgi:urocanate hydratase